MQIPANTPNTYRMPCIGCWQWGRPHIGLAAKHQIVNDKCDIIAASFRGEAVEWRDTGTGLICTAFVPAGEKVPEKCPLTVDMFEVPNAEITGG